MHVHVHVHTQCLRGLSNLGKFVLKRQLFGTVGLGKLFEMAGDRHTLTDVAGMHKFMNFGSLVVIILLATCNQMICWTTNCNNDAIAVGCTRDGQCGTVYCNNDTYNYTCSRSPSFGPPPNFPNINCTINGQLGNCLTTTMQPTTDEPTTTAEATSAAATTSVSTEPTIMSTAAARTQSVTTHIETGATQPQPAVTTPTQPVTTPAKPVTATTQPVTMHPQPTVTTPAQPVTTPAQPITTHPQPVTTPAQPVRTPTQPVTTQRRPNTTPKPQITSCTGENCFIISITVTLPPGGNDFSVAEDSVAIAMIIVVCVLTFATVVIVTCIIVVKIMACRNAPGESRDIQFSSHPTRNGYSPNDGRATRLWQHRFSRGQF